MLTLKILVFATFIFHAIAKNFEVPTNEYDVRKEFSESITTVSLKTGGDYAILQSLYINRQLLDTEAAELLIHTLQDAPSLRFLNLSSNQISGKFDLGRLQNLKKLEHFWINDNAITDLVFIAKYDVTSVTQLNFNNNNLTVININVFERFPNLIILSLDGNKITGAFDLGILIRLKSLSEFFFQRNNITDVFSTATEIMPSLTVLGLGENNINSINLDIFGKFSNLQKLALNNNKITGTIDLGKLKWLPSLTLLNLGENNINSINLEFSNLKELALNNNEITGTIDLGKLKWLKKLEKILINGNRINEVVNTATEIMPSLTLLYLGENNINSINLDIFGKFSNLKELALNDNEITGTIDLGKLQWLKNLEKFYIHGNRINEVVNTATEIMPSIESIILYKNNLTVLDLNFFSKFINLGKLQLHRNQLISIKGYEKATEILTKIRFISINNNNFVCSDLEKMTSKHQKDFWYVYDDIETSCPGLKSRLFEGISCCYPEIENLINDTIGLKQKQQNKTENIINEFEIDIALVLKELAEQKEKIQQLQDIINKESKAKNQFSEESLKIINDKQALENNKEKSEKIIKPTRMYDLPARSQLAVTQTSKS